MRPEESSSINRDLLMQIQRDLESIDTTPCRLAHEDLFYNGEFVPECPKVIKDKRIGCAHSREARNLLRKSSNALAGMEVISMEFAEQVSDILAVNQSIIIQLDGKVARDIYHNGEGTEYRNEHTKIVQTLAECRDELLDIVNAKLKEL